MRIFYVSTTGNDGWSGGLADPNRTLSDGPFATLARARDAIRSLHPAGPLSTPVTVYVRGGVYELRDTLTFSSQDSGTTASPVTYAAYGSEQPVLSGGRQITGWTHYVGTAVPPQVASQLWVAQVDDGWSFRQLFVNGHRGIRARTPNRGAYYNVDGSVTSWPLPAQFTYRGGDILAQWAQAGDVEAVVLQSWAETRGLITAVSASARKVTLATTFGPYGLEDNARYWVENAIEALDAPGEWYLDQKRHLLYYYPRAGEDMTTASIAAPFVGSLVQLRGNAAAGQFVSNIRFIGLTFRYADWSLPATGHAAQASFDVPAAVVGTAARSCTIQKSLFIHLGGYAVEFSQGSQDNVVVGNDMTDLGGGGVKIGDPQIPASASSNTARNQITDNTIFDIGEVFPSAVGLWVGQSADNVLAHNEIYDTYYSAISVGWTWGAGASGAARNLVQYNDLHDIGRGMLSDMGCIYTLGAQPGTTLSYNLCHEVSRSGYGAWGIYMDQGSSNILAENNVVYGTQDGGYLVSTDSQGNTIRNNILAMNVESQLWRVNSTVTQSFTFTRNIVFWNHGEFSKGVWQDNNFKFDYNLYYCPGACPTNGYSTFAGFLTTWKLLGQDVHSRVADPLFANPSQGDFTLGAGSPASSIGFQRIDLSTVGPRPEAQR